MEMPVIDLDRPGLDLTAEERKLTARCLGREGRLRASKPPASEGGGEAAYLWRILAFCLSPHPRHHCMPVMADLDLKVPDPSEEEVQEKSREIAALEPGCEEGPEQLRRRAWLRARRAKKEAVLARLNQLALKVEKSFPLSERPGTLVWARVYGVVPASRSIL